MSSIVGNDYETFCMVFSEVLRSDHHIQYLSKEEREMLLYTEPGVTIKYKFVKGYPGSPLYTQITYFLYTVMTTGRPPVLEMPNFVFDEGDHAKQRIIVLNSILRELRDAYTLWRHWNFNERVLKVAKILNKIRRRCFLDLMLVRKTKGSVEVLPWPREYMERACYSQKEFGTDLTVCGRAFAKHVARDSSEWWGKCTGTDAEKNTSGFNAVLRILNNAVWINIHHIPEGKIGMEIRIEKGYGLRFDYEPLSFRGFLEPYHVDGWLNKFKH